MVTGHLGDCGGGDGGAGERERAPSSSGGGGAGTTGPAAAASEGSERGDVHEAPWHEVAESTLGGVAAVQVRVVLPRLQGGVGGVELEMGSSSLGVSSAEYRLNIALPHRVHVDVAHAKLSSKRMELKITVLRAD